jgi:hypothetical protein
MTIMRIEEWPVGYSFDFILSQAFVNCNPVAYSLLSYVGQFASYRSLMYKVGFYEILLNDKSFILRNIR